MERQKWNANANANEAGNTATFVALIIALICNGALLGKIASVITAGMVSKNDMLILPIMVILAVVSIAVTVHMFRKYGCTLN